MVTYTNPDNNLTRKFGPDKATAKKGGEYTTTGADREIELKITLADLTESETILDDAIFLPKNARIKEIEIVTHTAAATGAAIDLGVIRRDRTTEIDYDGLLAAFPTASMNAAGEKNIITDNTTYDGALVGTTMSRSGYFTCSRTTATAFTDGVIFVKVRYYFA